jgi:hypothetical protein
MYVSLVTFLILAFLGAAQAEKLAVYPRPSASYPISTEFSVSVGSSKKQDSFVNSNLPPKDAPGQQKGKKLSWTTFSFSGSTTVFVHKLKGSTTGCTIKPSSLALKCNEQANNTVSITVTSTAKFSVEFADDPKFTNQLMIFADPLEVNPPTASTKDVIYFGVGEHSIGPRYRVANGKTVYIAGGAVVYGGFVSRLKAADITIRGRGIVSGKNMTHPKQADDLLALVNLCGNRITLEGITGIDAPTYNFQINAFWASACDQFGGGTGAVVKNVKAMSWYYTTDGIMAGRGALIEDSVCGLEVNKLLYAYTY